MSRPDGPRTSSRSRSRANAAGCWPPTPSGSTIGRPARHRSLLVDDTAHAKDLWRTLGRPGGVLADGEIVGTGRARKAGAAVAVSVDLWTTADRGAIGEQAERLAAFRGLTLKSLE